MDHLGDITCPTLVIVGSDDTPFLGATDYIERRIPDTERITVDGADHTVPATHADLLATHIHDFLTRRLG